MKKGVSRAPEGASSPQSALGQLCNAATRAFWMNPREAGLARGNPIHKKSGSKAKKDKKKRKGWFQGDGDGI
jgi:hypothetical protein